MNFSNTSANNKTPVFKDGLSLSNKLFFICFNDSPSKMMKNGFYFILKSCFVLKVFYLDFLGM